MDQDANQDKKPIHDRRLMVRYPAKATTIVTRETDVMRAGLEATLRDVSPTGLGIILETPLEQNESVKIRLTNQIQHFEKETRGTIRHITALADGSYHIGVELTLRLTPLDVSIMRMAMPHNDDAEGTTWI